MEVVGSSLLQHPPLISPRSHFYILSSHAHSTGSATSHMSASDREKQLAAKRAVEFVQDGMLVGLGTGSTSAFAIIELGNRVRTGLRITAASSSKASEDLARSVGITVVDFATLSRLDLTIDGADEIDANFHAVKGGGGALLREKVIAAASDKMIAIVDSSKVVSKIGKCKVPVEVLPFAM